jgi:hypothetical protein
MPKRAAHNDMCSLDNFLGIYGLNSTKSTDNTRRKLRYTHTGWRLAACFPALLHLGGTWVSSCLMWREGSVILTSLSSCMSILLWRSVCLYSFVPHRHYVITSSTSALAVLARRRRTPLRCGRLPPPRCCDRCSFTFAPSQPRE